MRAYAMTDTLNVPELSPSQVPLLTAEQWLNTEVQHPHQTFIEQ